MFCPNSVAIHTIKKMDINQENSKDYYRICPLLCKECPNSNCEEGKGCNLLCGCQSGHILYNVQQKEAKNSKFQPSEESNSERIEIDSTEKVSQKPSERRNCGSRTLSWLFQHWGLCTFVTMITIMLAGFIHIENSTKPNVDDFGSKYR